MTILSHENIDLAIQYALGNDKEFNKLSPGYRNSLLSILSDSNSSTLREALVLRMLNYISYTEKHGMDGYCPATGRQKEVKPRFVKEGTKVGTSGSFNDMTYDLLDKKDGCDVICAAFHEGRLLYIVEFPYEIIKNALKEKVDTILSKRSIKPTTRITCSFNYNNYDHDTLKVRYLNESLIKETKSISKAHFEMLQRRNLEIT